MGDAEEQKPKALPSNRELADAAAGRIRDAGKWLIASFAGVGAALIAGSQLSSIGQLEACLSPLADCARLWFALFGAAVGLAAVVWAIYTAVCLLAPEHIPPSRLAELWRDPKSPIHTFFSENRAYFQGFSDFDDMNQLEASARQRFKDLSKRFDQATSESERKRIAQEMNEVNTDLVDIVERGDEVVTLANRLVLEDSFRRRALPRLMLAATLAAVGIGLFAWAANPPESSDGLARSVGPSAGQIVFRVYGGSASLYGESWTPVDPTMIGPDSFRIAAGLPDRSNEGTYLVWGILDSPASVALVRSALPVTSEEQAYCPPYPGGLFEYVIPNPEEHVQVVGVVELTPDYGGDPGPCVSERVSPSA